MRRIAEVFTNRRRASRLSGASLFTIGIALVFACAPTFAETGYAPTASPHFGSEGSGDGELSAPRRIAVDQATGNILVADSGNDRIQVFTPFGANAIYLTQFGSGVLGEPYGIAIDQVNGDVYISDAGNERIVKYQTDGAPTPTYTQVGAFTSPTQGQSSSQIEDFHAPIAVDPTSGDILVADPGANVIDRYEDDGTFVDSFDGSTAPGGAFKALLDLAVGSSGNIVAVDSDGGNLLDKNATGRTIEFGPSGAYLRTIESGVTHDATVAIDSHNGNILLGQVTDGASYERFRGFAASGESLGTFTSRTVAGLANLTGIAVDSGASGRVYVAGDIGTDLPDYPNIPSAGTVRLTAFEPVPYPDISLDSASSSTPSTAIVKGTIDPHGVSTKWTISGTDSPVGGETAPVSGPVPISVELTGLDPKTNYTIRLVAHSAFADFSDEDPVSAPLSFTTAADQPRQVETIPPGEIEGTSARLGGWVNPRNSSTEYWFEYGLGDCASNPCASFPAGQNASAGAGLKSVLLTLELPNIDPGTRYHYRIVSRNEAGTTAGNDIVFTTDDPDLPGPPDRGFELVNSPDKGNQPALGYLLEDGAQVLWFASGGPGSPNGALSGFLASRFANGWRSQSAIPPVDEQLGGGTRAYSPLDVSPDGSRYLYNVGYVFASIPEYAFLDRQTHTQVALGRIGVSDGSQVHPQMFADAELHTIYASTFVPLVSGDNDGKPDLYTYEWGAHSWVLAGLRPDGSDPACPVLASKEADSPRITSSGANGERRVFFLMTPTDNCGEAKQLYVRDLVAGTTTAISTGNVSGELHEASFVRANSEGTAVVFQTSSALVPSDENEDSDLYLWREGAGNECLTCLASDAGVKDAMASPDLSYVYFRSNNRLVSDRGLAGDVNEWLYVIHDGELDYVAPLANKSEFGASSTYDDTSDNGSIAIFSTGGTGATASEPQGTEGAVYRYDADSRELQCISCSNNPSLGGLVRTLSGGANPARGGALRALDHDGEDIVFITRSPLSARDVNDAADIYEWRAGRVRLITDGVNDIEDNLSLAGISRDGANILFRAGRPLTGYELDGQAQLYVARAGGGFPPPPAPPAPCNEDACQGPLQAPPQLAGAGSAVLSGPGSAASRVKKHAKKKRHKKRHRTTGHRGHRRG